MTTLKRDRVRLQKYLAQCGVASRRKSEELIQAGRVKVNGSTVTEMGRTIDPTEDEVIFDGKPVHPESRHIVVLLNKPVGVISTASDPRGRTTVLDLVKDLPERLVPVGRLDYQSCGLILLTNDGDLCYAMTHPKHHVPKRYLVSVKYRFKEDDRLRFEAGIEIDGYTTRPAECKVLKRNGQHSLLEITLHEGRNRQIRKMMEVLGYPVNRLERIAIGNLTDPSLQPGHYRLLSEAEYRHLKEEHHV